MYTEFENNKESICNDLLILAELLNEHDLCKDTKSLYSASNFRYNTDINNWKYNVSIPITVNSIPSHIRPIDTEFLEINFSIEIEGTFVEEMNVENCLLDLKFDILISGLTNEGLNIATWHLDKHVGCDDDGESKFTHPEYHFSFGGNKMWEQNLDCGGILLHPSPRIPHPPMDAILGVDFILQNFIDRKDIFKLLNTPEYKNIVRNSQIRLWRPYMLATASHWCNYGGCGLNGKVELASKYYSTL